MWNIPAACLAGYKESRRMDNLLTLYPPPLFRQLADLFLIKRTLLSLFNYNHLSDFVKGIIFASEAGGFSS